MRLAIPYHKQSEEHTCGPAVLQMAFEYFGYLRPQHELVEHTATSPETGTNTALMVKAATEHGFYCYVNTHSSLREIRYFLKQELPVIVNFIEPSSDSGHFAVVSGLTPFSILLNDPWNGKNFRMSRKQFLARWYSEHQIEDVAWLMVLSRSAFPMGIQHSPAAMHSM